jgi:class 3 adenylate cyclase
VRSFGNCREGASDGFRNCTSDSVVSRALYAQVSRKICVGEEFMATAKPEVPAKGKSKPVRVYEVTSARTALRAAA